MRSVFWSISSPKAAWTAWVATVLVVCIRLAVSNTPTRQNVFPVYQNAGAAWLAGENLYRDSKYDYRYSPTFALAMTPFAGLPLKAGSILWRLFSGTALLAALVWASRAGIPQKWANRERWLMLLAILPLSLGNLNNGQANLLVLAALVAASAAVARGHWTIAAITLALPVMTKVYPVVFAGLLLVLFPRQLAWRFPLAVLVGFAVPFAFQRPDYVLREYGDWLHYLRTEDRTSRPIAEWYSDVRIIFRVWLVPISTHVYCLLQAITAAALAVFSAYRQRRGWPVERLVGWILSLACCWMTALGPATESSTFVLIAPATAWVVCDLLTHGGSFRQKTWVSAIYLLQLLAGIGAWFGGLRPISGYANPLLLATLLLAGYLLRPALFRNMAASGANSVPVFN